MEIESLAILISCFSLLVAAFSLGWNIFRDVILKPRLKVRLSIKHIVGSLFPQEPIDTLMLSVTNFGPGTIKCEMIHFKATSILRRIRKKREQGVILHDYENPLSHKLPCKLEVGESADFLLPLDDRCILNSDVTHIGMRDSFGRIHWASKEDIKEAKKLYKKQYRQETPTKKTSYVKHVK